MEKEKGRKCLCCKEASAMEENGDMGIRGIFLPLGFPPLSTVVVPGILVNANCIFLRI